MEDDLRHELNKIWADLKALRMLVAHDVGKRWGLAEVEHWHERRIAAAEKRETEAPAVTANYLRALDDLAHRLRLGAGWRPPELPE